MIRIMAAAVHTALHRGQFRRPEIMTKTGYHQAPILAPEAS